MMQLYESMTRLTVGNYVVRVWCAELSPVMGPNCRVRGELFWLDAKEKEIEEIVKILDATEGVSAYEILDINGNGLVVYRDWP